MQTAVGLRFLRVLASQGEGMPAYMRDERKSTQHPDRPSATARDEVGRSAALNARTTPR